VAIGGARLWDTSEYSFQSYIRYVPNPRAKKLTEEDFSKENAERIFERDLTRLEMSLKSLDPQAEFRIAMTHYPPIDADLHPSKASALLKKYKIQQCVFGHLHNIKEGLSLFGKRDGIDYHLVAADYLNFVPKKIL